MIHVENLGGELVQTLLDESERSFPRHLMRVFLLKWRNTSMAKVEIQVKCSYGERLDETMMRLMGEDV